MRGSGRHSNAIGRVAASEPETRGKCGRPIPGQDYGCQVEVLIETDGHGGILDWERDGKGGYRLHQCKSPEAR